MLRGDWYLDEPGLAAERRRCWRMLDRFNATGAVDDAERRRILEELLAKFSPGASVLPRFHCSYGTLISIGANSFVNNDALFMDDALITIGDNAWLGAGVIVCPGVTIEENAVIGAGSVVVRDIPDQVIAAGNPARTIRRL
ncbi:maltose acetyltransferase domain-containing protein [Amycolatopsis pigmentata]